MKTIYIDHNSPELTAYLAGFSGVRVIHQEGDALRIAKTEKRSSGTLVEYHDDMPESELRKLRKGIVRLILAENSRWMDDPETVCSRTIPASHPQFPASVAENHSDAVRVRYYKHRGTGETRRTVEIES